MRPTLTRVPLGLAFLLMATVLTSTPATAAIIEVTQAGDGEAGPGCTLRQAIRAANVIDSVLFCFHPETTTPDTIVLPAGVYELSRAGSDDTAEDGDLDITDDLTIVGAGSADTIIDASGMATERVFHVLAGAAVEISGVTITGGTDNGFTGGGVLNEGNLTLDAVEVRDNASSAGGGGISTSGALTVRGSTIANNSAGTSGGGLSHAGGALTLLRSTFSGNDAAGDGGGIFSGAGGSISYVTVVGNEADSDGAGGGDGGGLTETSTVTLGRSVVAGNTDGSPGAEKPDCDSVGLTSDGHNVIGDSSGCVFSPADATDVLDEDAGLVPLLLDNGGPTETHAISASSPARNLIPRAHASCGGVDQRGVPRPAGAACDAGAYERAACLGRLVNRVGTPGADVLIGTAGPDGVIGLGGGDTIRTGAGSDRVCAGPGNDVVRLGGGNDRATGGGGRDLLVGGAGRDVLRGNRGPDRLRGGGGRDSLFGNAGNDVLAGGPGRDRCRQGPGSGRITGCEV